VVAHDIETDTAKKISAVEILQPGRKIHRFVFLTSSTKVCFRSRELPHRLSRLFSRLCAVPD
jgi:hypothetical protein